MVLGGGPHPSKTLADMHAVKLGMTCQPVVNPPKFKRLLECHVSSMRA